MILKRIDPHVPLAIFIMAFRSYFIFHQTPLNRDILIYAQMFCSGYCLCKAIYWRQIEAAKPPKRPSIFPLFG
jgi:hypothetical protein